MGYNGSGFPPAWDTPQNNFRMFDEFSSVVSEKAEAFFHCIPHFNGFSSIVSHTTKESSGCVSHNAEGSVPLWDTAEKNDTTQDKIFF